VKDVKDYYNKTAHEWAEEWYSNETMLPLLKKFVELFRDNTPRILDAGCGAGYESMRLASLGAEVVGIDISDESVKIARAKNPDCRFEVMDCKNIDKSLCIFDGVIALALIVHIDDRDLKIIFDNFQKIIKPCGFLFVAFVEGDGFCEKRSFVKVGDEEFNRAFYLHQTDRVKEAAENSGFNFHAEWFLPEPIGKWKWYVFKAMTEPLSKK
jgi:2-polyprenyl-3-methyl-5-hydroxy-6-metoxy-1,4-benzoquinol methylase